MILKRTIFIVILLFTVVLHCQEVKLTDNISFEIKEIKYKKSIRSGLYWTFAPKGYRYLVIKAKFYGKSGKREKLPLFEMSFATQKEKYKVRPYFDVGPEYVKGYYIKVRRKKNWDLYVIIDDDFEKGVLSFKNKEIMNISVKEGEKIADYNILTE
ncbi:hypothetical protein [Tenacibaculum aiptasiae]|uniref:hypothetical protein n=1 Tax=Tenacibaculum aiptasiae TaxID=426481 RepID=UPI003B58CF53